MLGYLFSLVRSFVLCFLRYLVLSVFHSSVRSFVRYVVMPLFLVVGYMDSLVSSWR